MSQVDPLCRSGWRGRNVPHLGRNFAKYVAPFVVSVQTVDASFPHTRIDDSTYLRFACMHREVGKWLKWGAQGLGLRALCAAPAHSRNSRDIGPRVPRVWGHGSFLEAASHRQCRSPVHHVNMSREFPLLSSRGCQSGGDHLMRPTELQCKGERNEVNQRWETC